MEKVVQVTPEHAREAQAVTPDVQSQPPRTVLRKFNNDTKKPNMKKFSTLIIALLVILAGVGTGWGLSRVSAGDETAGTSAPEGVAVGDQTVGSDNEVGIKDDEAFPDTAEGILREGGTDGEGTHHLERGVGPEQYAYLTSSVIDLQSFVGKKVQVWGQTLSGQEAGWLMDVGRIKVLE